MELFTLENGSAVKKMGTGNKFGLTVQSTMVNGEKIRLTVKGNWCTPMEIYMKVSGKMIKPMAMEVTSMLMVQPTLENGRMISNMEGESRHGPMVPSMKVLTMKGKSMEREP